MVSGKEDLTSTTDISQFLDMLGDHDFHAGSASSVTESCLPDLPVVLPSAGAESNDSSSGQSSPQHCSNPRPALMRFHSKEGATRSSDLDFAVEDIDMWDMLMTLDGEPPMALDGSAVSGPSALAPASEAPFGRMPEAFLAATATNDEFPLAPFTPLKPAQVKKARAKSVERPRTQGGGGGKPVSKAAARTASLDVPAPLASPLSKHVLPPPPKMAPKTAAAAARASSSSSAAASSPLAKGERSSGGSTKGERSSGGSTPEAVAEAEAFAGHAEDDEGEGAGDDPNESAEEKRLKRMRRNRESAAMSRSRKKQYVEELEAQVAFLQESVRALQSQNVELRRNITHVGEPGSLSPSLPLPSPPLPSSLPIRPPLPDLGLLEDLDASNFIDPTPIRPSPSAKALSAAAGGLPLPSPHPSIKRSGSPLIGGSAKRASAASLALMSAITFVTLSFGSSHRAALAEGLVAHGDRRHSPTSRVLMSLTDMATPSLPSMAWPSVRDAAMYDVTAPPLTVSAGAASTAKNALPAPAPEAAAADQLSAMAEQARRTMAMAEVAVATAPRARGYAERVIRAPHNSSWRDVLRIEAAEKQLAEAQLALRTLRAAHELPPSTQLHQPPAAKEADAPAAAAAADTSMALAAPRSSLEASKARANAWSTTYDAGHLDEDAATEYDAQRYIFCSRAYMFDAAVRRPMAPAASVAGHELDLPSAMPPRFRHAAAYRAGAQVPQVADASGTPANVSAPPGAATGKGPVVTLLLPSAALQGVRGVDDADGAPETAHEARTTPPNSDKELMQVQCQVLNASRWSA